MMRMIPLTVAIALPLALHAAASAQERELSIDANRAALEAYFDHHVSRLADGSDLRHIESAEHWQEQREAVREQLADMLGLHPMPERGPLNAEVTGAVEHDDFIVEKVHFQALPGLYVTGNLYIPNGLDEPAPTILYLCGHAPRVSDGVSFGNKTAYQRHPAWFARHGYVSLVVDTIQLGEIQGLHHGTHREGMWWWNSRGYTPAGVEAFNAMRAIDYLETRHEVDAERIGVTGRSGGGIGTLYLAALDDRVAVAAPVAGITDIQNHVGDHITPGHCDCNYFPNVHRLDYARIVGLITPRPLLIANTDKDNIFPLNGVQRVHRQVQHLYHLHDASDRLGLTITEGGHADTQPLRVPVFSWFNRFLKDEDPLIDQPAVPFVDDSELRVFDELPEDEIVTSIHDTFVPVGQVEVPTSASDWRAQRGELLSRLRATAFANWAADLPEPEATQVFSAEAEGVRLSAYDFESEPHAPLRLYIARAAGAEDPMSRIELRLLDDAAWGTFLAAAQTAFADDLSAELAMYPGIEPDAETAEAMRDVLRAENVAYVVLAPRGVGPAAWSDGGRDAVHLRRNFPILGQTLDGQRVFDVLRTLALIRQHPGARQVPLHVHADADAAGVALYAAALDGDIDALVLGELPASHHEDHAPELLHVLRFMDMPQALALALEHSDVTLLDADPDAWHHARRVAELLDRADALRFE